MTTFKDIGLSDELLAHLETIGYEKPTDIQRLVIPSVLMGRDVLGCAQTGTGKTASFVLPLLDILANGHSKARMPRVLILEPTRELAQQVSDAISKYGKKHDITYTTLIGGELMGPQIKALGQNIDIIVATPGRLLDLFEKGKLLMSQMNLFVIDEADRMMDMGFIPDIEDIVKKLPSNRQTLFFSATIPKEIRGIAQKFLNNPKEVTVAPQTTTASTIEEFLVKAPVIKKREVLRHILNTESQRDVTIIFSNRKKDVDILVRSLNRHGMEARAIHGDLSQDQREQALRDVREGKVKILVASDVAARGIDIPEITHVINFDVPMNPEEYVHRIGRTGRAGRTGKAFMLCAPNEDKFLQGVQKFVKKQIPLIQLEDLDLGGKKAEKGEGKSRQNKKEHGDVSLEIYKTEMNKKPVKGFGEHVPAFMQRG